MKDGWISQSVKGAFCEMTKIIESVGYFGGTRFSQGQQLLGNHISNTTKALGQVTLSEIANLCLDVSEQCPLDKKYLQVNYLGEAWDGEVEVQSWQIGEGRNGEVVLRQIM